MRGVRLHFEKIVFIFPDERYVFEFLDVVFWCDACQLLIRILLICEQEIVYQLFSPFYYASDDVQR